MLFLFTCNTIAINLSKLVKRKKIHRTYSVQEAKTHHRLKTVTVRVTVTKLCRICNGLEFQQDSQSIYYRVLSDSLFSYVDKRESIRIMSSVL